MGDGAVGEARGDAGQPRGEPPGIALTAPTPRSRATRGTA